LGEQSETDPVDLGATRDGELVIPADAHIRLANPHNNDGQGMLRRGYSYSEGVEPESGEIDAGLFFIAFQRSPTRQFIPLQQRLAASDALNHHTLHIAGPLDLVCRVRPTRSSASVIATMCARVRYEGLRLSASSMAAWRASR
jgi:deferrochelatase/peroxidase EfeB